MAHAPARTLSGLLASELRRLCEGRHGDPFAVLGPHDGWLRVFRPGAASVGIDGGAALQRVHDDGFFEGPLPASARATYRLRVRWESGLESVLDDPYRHGPLLGEIDAWLLAEGTHLRPAEVLGADPRNVGGVAGTAFAVWAPNASRASVVGDFNAWDGRVHPMRLRRECGVWELFVPGVAAGERYKFELLDREGRLLPQKADPLARRGELRPSTASVVAALPPRLPVSRERAAANALDAPMSIYEVHLASWRRKPEEGDRWLDWDELADTLIPYATGLGFTHLELLPVSEHPFDGSWGYQTLGLYAPTARHGEPDGLRRFIERAHAQGLGVLLDWVPAHFPTDAWGLARFDGTHLYEYADPREGWHHDWNTLIYNYGRTEVRGFLAGSALHWLERYGADGLRVDAVASMLYRDYSRKAGEWIPNAHGGRENLEAISLLKHVSEVIGGERAGAVTLAEESTAFPGVSRPTYLGGLGFHYKWNMGWMHDTLKYVSRDPIHRPYHHGELTFGLVYAFSENFVLPLSHDEVVHGKGSLLAKMPGDDWQRFANLRAYYGFMWAHPGKKLLFMGGELAQPWEWDHRGELPWWLLQEPAHAGVRQLVGDLNRLYRELGPLHRRDFEGRGFRWLRWDDADSSVLAYLRLDAEREVIVLLNFTPVPREGYRIGAPRAGCWREVFNSDSRFYGGSDIGNPLPLQSEPLPWMDQPQSLVVTLPPLAGILLVRQA